MQSKRRVGNMASIFDKLEYTHTDLNSVDESSPLYRPPSREKKVRFGFTPQDMAYSDSNLTSDDGECTKYSTSSSFSRPTEFDSLLELSAYDSMHGFPPEQEQPDELSSMLDLLMEDANTIPFVEESTQNSESSPSSFSSSQPLKDDDDEVIEEFPPEPPVLQPTSTSSLSLPISTELEEVIDIPQSPIKIQQAESSKPSTTATRKKRKPKTTN
jgi:hypothetical protein